MIKKQTKNIGLFALIILVFYLGESKQGLSSDDELDVRQVEDQAKMLQEAMKKMQNSEGDLDLEKMKEKFRGSEKKREEERGVAAISSSGKSIDLPAFLNLIPEKFKTNFPKAYKFLEALSTDKAFMTNLHSALNNIKHRNLYLGVSGFIVFFCFMWSFFGGGYESLFSYVFRKIKITLFFIVAQLALFYFLYPGISHIILHHARVVFF